MECCTGSEGAMDAGILSKELQASFEREFTQPAAALPSPQRGKSSFIPVGPWKDDAPLASSIRIICDVYLFFKAYIHQLSVLLLTGVVAVLACALRGDIFLFAHLSYKTITTSLNITDHHYDDTDPSHLYFANSTHQTYQNITSRNTILPNYLQLPDSYNLPDLLYHIAMSIMSSEITYHSICGFLQVYFYVVKRGEPEKWKCQPHRFLTRSNEIHEIIVGTSNMFFAGAVSGFLTCWIKNGNYSTMYFRLDEYGYLYLVFSIIALFLWLEATAYYIHAMLHIPFFYKTLHKHHHRYHSPTAYSAISMSPIELSFLDAAIILPLFVVPINAMVFVVELAYVYYFGLMDHSGVMMDSWFPWQPHTKFHDDHHRYFHCNFGFNTYLFDRLHGTLRKKDRVYGEKIFGGKGKKQE